MRFVPRTAALALILAATPALAQQHDMPTHSQQSGA